MKMPGLVVESQQAATLGITHSSSVTNHNLNIVGLHIGIIAT